MKALLVPTVRRPLRAVLRTSPSKSDTHRALVAAGLARGTSRIGSPLRADDTRITRNALRALGIPVTVDGEAWVVEGAGGVPEGGADLFLRDSGTSFRFLTAVAALGRRASRLDGSSRLRERPVRELARALLSLGGRVEVQGAGGGLPLSCGGAIPVGGSVRVAAGRSSQFASALLLIAPLLSEGLELTLEPPVVSRPYLDLTVDVMRRFGAEIESLGAVDGWRVAPSGYVARDYLVEGDHSSASYFLAAAAILGGTVRVLGLRPDSRQPDARLSRLLEGLGCRRRTGPDWIEIEAGGELPGFDVDLSDAPDLAPTVAVLALFARGESRLRGVAHLRIKESDRLEMIARNLHALGCPARADDSSIVIGPARGAQGTRIETASDHRIAMAFAVAGLRVPGVAIDDPECVAKSNPDFWDQLARLTAD